MMRKPILAAASVLFITLAAVTLVALADQDVNNIDPSGALPHLAVGGSWTTELVVVNTGAELEQFTISFYDDNGAPLTLPVAGLGNLSVVSGGLPPRATAYYELSDPYGPLRTGWGRIAGDSLVRVQALFRNRTAQGLHYEAAVPATPGGYAFIMPFDGRNFAETGAPLYTGFAVANLDPLAVATVTCLALDENASIIPNGVSVPPLRPNGHFANYLFPNLTGRRGTLSCVSNTKVAALGLRFIGTETFTSLSVYWR